jgi:transposase
MEVHAMAKKVMKSVKTKGVGFAPILKHFFDRCAIQDIIDQNVHLDPRRKVLTHGQACISMITGILFQVMQLYKICQFADKTTILDVILPGIAPEEYFDDRMADTLDALYAHGIGDLELLITRMMISEFNIVSNICHNDTTSLSVFGECNNHKTDQSIKITFGHSKKHRKDLKQLVWSLSVSSDSGFPLFQKAYSGNTADVKTYVEQWHNLIDLLACRDFLYVADSKLITHENMAHIHDYDGFFISPAPMYESYKTLFHQAISEHDHEVLLPYKDQINRGFEVPLSIRHEEKDYHFRMIIVFDHGLFARKRRTLLNRVEKTKKTFNELTKKLNAYRLKTETAIDKACRSILNKNQTTGLFDFQIHNDPITTYKNKKQGRPVKGAEKVAVTTDHFSVTLTFNEPAFDEAQSRCGYYPLITNMPEESLSIESAMMAHKNQYKCEHINRRAKSGYNIEPIYLHTPERIEAFLFLFKIALQVIVLIERTARENISLKDKGLDKFMPNRKDVRNPRTENLLADFQFVVSGETVLPDGNRYGFVSELTDLQEDILSILEVPLECFSYGYLFDTS